MDIKELIKKGESINVEFKTANSILPKNLFETVCAFLNTNGGYIILGVNDKNEIIGVDEYYVDKLKKDFTSKCNNEEVINPTIYCELKEIEVNGKILLYTYIEESKTVHKTKNKVFIRNYEGDFDITNNMNLIVQIHNQKSKIYDEDKIYPYIDIENDLNHELINKSRRLADANINKRHPWLDMSDLELLKSAGLYKKDPITKEEGITLAGIMLFGKDRVILNANPYCRTDAILRVDDLDRYDDRDFVETNLLDMYDRLLDFIKKYTKDRFTLNDKNIRVSAMSIIAREMVLNSLIHRSILDGHTSRVIIYEDKMIMENPNSFSTMRYLTIHNYFLFPKNPTLAKFFREIGYADELGSGIKRITENSLLYSGKLPIIEDKEMFRITIPLVKDKMYSDEELKKLSNKDENNELNSDEKIILSMLVNNPFITAEEMSEKTNFSKRKIYRIYDKLKESNYIERNGSDKNGSWKIIKKQD